MAHLYLTPLINTYYKDIINPNHVVKYATGESATPLNSFPFIAVSK
jgi:hypothetical protein